MEAERITSKGRFSRGSLTMGAAIESALSTDNSSTHKHEKVNNRFKKQLRSNNDLLGCALLPFLYITFTENSLEQESVKVNGEQIELERV